MFSVINNRMWARLHTATGHGSAAPCVLFFVLFARVSFFVWEFNKGQQQRCQKIPARRSVNKKQMDDCAVEETETLNNNKSTTSMDK
eukprot:m.350289 g.350289  ORF g.350289 m.350289 type:complete len:87 (+) comp19888_c3_seq3:857-1117(+)